MSLVAPFQKQASQEARRNWARYLKVDEFVTNLVGIKMALIPPGDFTMGSPESERSRGDETQHAVHISRAFYLGVYEVTQAEFGAAMHRNPSFFASSGEGKDKVAGVNTAHFPVDSISWYDAIELCNQVSAKEKLKPYYSLTGIERAQDGRINLAEVRMQGGDGYRLPTEAEWEYACRSGTTTPYSFGTTIDRTMANTCRVLPDGAAAYDLGRSARVGSYAPNAFGLFDMHGNALEWCWDWIATYGQEPQTDPTGPPSGSQRVLRSGSWALGRLVSRCTARVSADPGGYSEDRGVRLARTP